jgi:hypothetical protein
MDEESFERLSRRALNAVELCDRILEMIEEEVPRGARAKAVDFFNSVEESVKEVRETIKKTGEVTKKQSRALENWSEAVGKWVPD